MDAREAGPSGCLLWPWCQVHTICMHKMPSVALSLICIPPYSAQATNWPSLRSHVPCDTAKPSSAAHNAHLRVHIRGRAGAFLVYPGGSRLSASIYISKEGSQQTCTAGVASSVAWSLNQYSSHISSANCRSRVASCLPSESMQTGHRSASYRGRPGQTRGSRKPGQAHPLHMAYADPYPTSNRRSVQSSASQSPPDLGLPAPAIHLPKQGFWPTQNTRQVTYLWKDTGRAVTRQGIERPSFIRAECEWFLLSSAQVGWRLLCHVFCPPGFCTLLTLRPRLYKKRLAMLDRHQS